MTEGGRFEDVLASLVRIFQERSVPHALIGGLAVAAWGAPRATEDIDLLADVNPSPELDAAFRATGFEAEWRRRDPGDPVPLLLRLCSASGPEIDVICATRDWEREMLDRAIRVRLPEGPETPVIAVEDLVVLKLMAGGPRTSPTSPTCSNASAPSRNWRSARGVLDLLRRVRASTGHQLPSE